MIPHFPPPLLPRGTGRANLQKAGIGIIQPLQKGYLGQCPVIYTVFRKGILFTAIYLKISAILPLDSLAYQYIN
jgi:hypothetical protein